MSSRNKRDYGETLLRRVEFLTDAQKLYHETIMSNDITFGTGYPGTGKSFVACYSGLLALQRGQVSKLVITKPAVEVGDNSLGFLPGDLEEKMAPFVRSVEECIASIVGHEGLQSMRDRKTLEVLPLNHMRGLTIDHSFVVADEMQNANYLQTKTFLTRIGEGSKYVLNGDLGQTDIHTGSGLPVFLRMLRGMHGVGVVDFELEDIVRSGILRDIMVRIYEHENRAQAQPERANLQAAA